MMLGNSLALFSSGRVSGRFGSWQLPRFEASRPETRLRYTRQAGLDSNSSRGVHEFGQGYQLTCLRCGELNDQSRPRDWHGD